MEEVNIQIDLTPYPFDKDSLPEIEKNKWVKNQWPLVYFIENNDSKEAYIGESTNALNRINNHFANPERTRLKKITLIGCDRFNKSATLDIESQLIQYIASDGLYTLQNGNAGLQHHNYYQQDIYKGLFRQIWSKLEEANLVSKSMEDIENSNIFKYSPYKSLSPDQHNSVLSIIKLFNEKKPISIFVEGSAGTGKTILATYLMKLLHSYGMAEDEISDASDLFLEENNLVTTFNQKFNEPVIGLVVPMTSLRKTLKNVFSKVSGLKSSMVIGPSDVFKKNYDILIVDEAHRLSRRQNIPNYGSFDANNRKLGLGKEGTQLDWIMKNSKYQVFFYDPAQSVKPSDIPTSIFSKLMSDSHTEILKLKSQMRVTAGSDYISFVDTLLNCRINESTIRFEPKDYELKVFDSFRELYSIMKEKEEEHGLCRFIAGYSWEWVSKKSNEKDINIEGLEFYWNREDKDWINSENSFEEIGCIHTTQGYDLNYAAVIFGKEITYNPELNKIEIIRDNYCDRNGKAGIKDDEVLKEYIINIYKTIMYRGIKGTFIYVWDASLREYLKNHINHLDASDLNEPDEISAEYHSRPRKPFTLIESSKVVPFKNSIPLYDIKAAAGEFSDLQSVEDVDWVALPKPFKHSKDYFICRVTGESMNKIIPNGSWCLFRKYTGGTRQGKIVLAEHYNIQDSDFGAGYTVKQYNSSKTATEDGSWTHTSVELNPLSFDPGYEPIIFNERDEIEELNVLGIFERVL